ncbi:MAG: UTP--glucose-1-phosphate uridylyltransferase [Pirellulaceae bacterium]|nr:UTP--glucose-1-phosphate uridylyltransferase [Planctomycetales bacterium]
MAPHTVAPSPLRGSLADELLKTIRSQEPDFRNRSLGSMCHTHGTSELLAACDVLDRFRRDSANLYERVRALFFLHGIYRYYLPPLFEGTAPGRISQHGLQHLLNRRFDEAIDEFRRHATQYGTNDTVCSSLAAAYHSLGFQTLANQVRRSVRSVRGNQWMFRMGHPADHPLRLHPALLRRDASSNLYPCLCERTPVRMDLSHSGWSDIFFLGMDYPEGARVLNISIDLGVHGRDTKPAPPIEVYLRVIDEPVLRLASVDLKAATTVTTLREVFDFARDYLGLLKAAIIAAGIIPPGLEGSQQELGAVLARVVGPGMGLEVVSTVNDIPKGSRLAVSTNLLAGIIAVCMRATRQVASLTGPLSEAERRLVAARAILGEWIGGSGGGWQDSGGVWPGIKLIEGQAAGPDDPEHGISRGRLLPNHTICDEHDIALRQRQALCDSLVLVHGGMAQDVGPILQMVTEKYLTRSDRPWKGRLRATELLDDILDSLRRGDVRALASATTTNFEQPIQTIIPWACNHYTQTLIDGARQRFGDDFWGFLMLGGMSGGGMGFFFAPRVRALAVPFLLQLMRTNKSQLGSALPFAMEPVVYDFAINDSGTSATISTERPLMPSGYYPLVAPDWLRQKPHELSPQRRAEISLVASETATDGRLEKAANQLLSSLLPQHSVEQDTRQTLQKLLVENGFDEELHERIRHDLRTGRIGLAQNRLPASTTVEDVLEKDVLTLDDRHADQQAIDIGSQAIASGEVAIVSLAAGAGSRWTHGAGVVKALHPFHRFGGKYRNFIEVHLAKGQRIAQQFGTMAPHVVTTSYLTHDPIADWLERSHLQDARQSIYLSRGRSVGLRMIPMSRDLRFAWNETTQQLLDEQAQKVRESLHGALIQWAEHTGCGSDYTDNVPLQCLHPVGHWFEMPNMLRNGTFRQLLADRPQLKYLMLHNIDTLGAGIDPLPLGTHIRSAACLSFEVISRRIDDRGGGLARVNGQVRLLESLAMPREEDECKLTYYNSMTTWISIDALLAAMRLDRDSLGDANLVAGAVRRMSMRLPTYITIKDVKRRWGHGQEDIFPVSQFEKLWGDMSSLPELPCNFFVVPRARGQQLKEQAQLDGWLNDGSADYVDRRCLWG